MLMEDIAGIKSDVNATSDECDYETDRGRPFDRTFSNRARSRTRSPSPSFVVRNNSNEDNNTIAERRAFQTADGRKLKLTLFSEEATAVESVEELKKTCSSHDIDVEVSESLTPTCLISFNGFIVLLWKIVEQSIGSFAKFDESVDSLKAILILMNR